MDSTHETAACVTAARQHLQAGRLLEAKRLCQTVLHQQPKHAEALLLSGIISHQMCQLPAAIDHVERAIAADPQSSSYRVTLGDMLLHTRRFREAAAAYQQALAIDPTLPRVRGKLGVALQEAGQLEAAVEHYRLALRAEPESVELYYNLGTVLKRQHQFEQAIDTYGRAAQLAPQNVDMQYKFGVLLVENGRFEQAAAALETVVRLDPKRPGTYDYLAYARMKLGQGDASVTAARRYMALTGGGLPALRILSTALLCKGDVGEASAVCDRILSLDPGSRVALSGKAIALSALGDKSGARHLVDYDRFLRVSHLSPPSGYADIGAFNAALVRHIQSHPSLRFDNLSSSCHNGATSDELLAEPKGPVARLEAMIFAAGKEYRRALANDPGHPYVANLPAAWELSAWATILRSHGYQHGHTHPTAWLSGVYYVSLPSVVGSEGAGQSGWIEFGRAPYFYRCADQGEIRSVPPTEGMMVLFPSYFYHRTIPFEGAENRITIAFDFRQTD
jgi:tetratricopeptide (TPR) repeat protein